MTLLNLVTNALVLFSFLHFKKLSEQPYISFNYIPFFSFTFGGLIKLRNFCATLLIKLGITSFRAVLFPFRQILSRATKGKKKLSPAERKWEGNHSQR